jgi:hypothetical protein
MFAIRYWSLRVPSGLPYWITVDVVIIDATTGGTVGLHRKHRLWVSGVNAAAQGSVYYELAALRSALSPGRYFVRLRFRVIDMLGHSTVGRYTGNDILMNVPE